MAIHRNGIIGGFAGKVYPDNNDWEISKLITALRVIAGLIALFLFLPPFGQLITL